MGEQPPCNGLNARNQQAVQKKTKRETAVSQRLINFALPMYKQLTSEQRYTIFVLLQRKCSRKSIAEAIKVHPSTVTRELRRNSSRRGVYKWEKAQKQAEARGRRTPGNRAISRLVWDEVRRHLVNDQWSPEQISGYLARQGFRISHETIYKWIRADKRNRGTLYKYLRHRLKHRRRPVGAAGRHCIPDRVGIEERPGEADGNRFGDFEMDTIVGPNNQQAIVTIVERSTNRLFMKKLEHGKDSRELARAVIGMLLPFKDCIRTITTDNGSEFAAHRMISEALGAKVYFTDPYSSWQKGAIENANGLVRQYIPKGMTFKDVSDEEIRLIQDKINDRPRKKLHFSTPNEIFKQKFSSLRWIM